MEERSSTGIVTTGLKSRMMWTDRPKGTKLANAQVTTIRLKTFNVANRVMTSVRRGVLYLSNSYPYQQLFTRLVARWVSD